MRIKFRCLLLLILLLSTNIALSSSQYDWEKVRDQDGIQVYLKKFWAESVKSFKGVIHIHASAASLLAVITDISACPDWIYHCKNPHLLLRKSFSECYHYQVHQLPFPAKNREFIFYSKIIRLPETGAIHIIMNAVADFCLLQKQACSVIEQSSLPRVRHSHGYYLLEPIAHNMTRITWVHHTDPGDDLPRWLTNLLIQEMPFQTLKGLRKKVLELKYQKAKLIINRHGQILALSTSYE